MTITSSNFAELLYPGLKAIYGNTIDLWAPEYEQIFDSESSSKESESYLEIAGLGLVPTKVSTAETQYDALLQGQKSAITNLIYSLGVKISREMKDDDQYKIMNDLSKYLAISVARTMETEAALILDRAFNSSYLGSDGVELCSRLHPLTGGGTFANTPATQADLSMTSYEQAKIDIASFKDGRNLAIKVMPKLLIVSPNDEATAKKLMLSAQDPETSHNAINPFQNDMKFVVSHYVTDPDAWFIRTNVPGLICQKRIWPAEFTADNQFGSDVAAFKTYFRAAFGWSNPRSIYGVSGA